MMPLGLFRSRNVSVAVAVGFAFMVGYYGLPFVMGLYLQQLRGLSPLATGAAFLPMMVIGAQESMMQAIRSTRPGGHVGYVGVAHSVELPGQELFYSHVHLHGGPAPVRRFLPELIDRIWNRTINPGKVFDLELPLEQAAEGYRAMDERRAIKTLLRP